jgi:hypothetical protein
VHLSPKGVIISRFFGASYGLLEENYPFNLEFLAQSIEELVDSTIGPTICAGVEVCIGG